MTLLAYTKPHAPALQRVTHLRSKGLIVTQPNVAARRIELIGYERLRIYFLSRRLPSPGRPFRPGTSYQDILRLYECDALLRNACFQAVGQFEILLRNSISENMSARHGSHPYFDAAAFRDAPNSLKALKTIVNAYQRSRDERADHYGKTYSHPALPPIWTMKEFLTFGTAAHVLKCLSGPLRTAIAADFGIPKDTIFESWVECFVDLRNICAHHDRLFNRSFQKQPATLTVAAPAHILVPTAPKRKLKAVLECLDHVLVRRGVPSRTTATVAAIIARHPAMNPGEAGF